MIPSGAQGKEYVKELTRMFDAFATESALESIAVTAAMTMPALLLQKPHAKSKSKDHTVCLKRRLELWKLGKIEELISEGRTIQTLLKQTRCKAKDISLPQGFAQKMMKGTRDQH